MDKLTFNTTEDTIFIINRKLDECGTLQNLFRAVNLRVQTYDNPSTFLNEYTYQTGCLILDVRFPVMSGLELLNKLEENNISLSPIVITSDGDVPMAVTAMKSGAEDFLTNPINPHYLLETVQRCLKMNKTSRLSNANTLIEDFRKLTSREVEVFKEVTEGKSNKQIARDLNISLSTVEAHRAKVMKKTNSKSFASLVKFYFNLSQLPQFRFQ
ncbi:response regulator transcription factor [Legionella lytica]|uniref:Response regulator transcription factor n=1 Tax=Legionella lytica TaxID=96232 RepID=A0ABW8DCM6_9GAMM